MATYSNTRVTKVEARKLLKQVQESKTLSTWTRWYMLRLLHTVLGTAKRKR